MNPNNGEVMAMASYPTLIQHLLAAHLDKEGRTAARAL